MPEDAYHELLYVRRHYLHADALRNAIAHVANAIFRIRAAHIWGRARRPVPRTRSILGRGTRIC